MLSRTAATKKSSSNNPPIALFEYVLSSHSLSIDWIWAYLSLLKLCYNQFFSVKFRNKRLGLKTINYLWFILTISFLTNLPFLITCSDIKKTKPRIHKFKVHTAKRPASLLNPLYNDVLSLIHYFKKHFKPCFFILKAFKDILQHFKFVNWWIRGFVFLMSRTG